MDPGGGEGGQEEEGEEVEEKKAAAPGEGDPAKSGVSVMDAETCPPNSVSDKKIGLQTVFFSTSDTIQFDYSTNW